MNNFKLIFRQLWRNRLFTLLNIVGLSIGISACWVIFRIVNYEFSFDQKHPDKELIYKVHTSYLENNKTDHFDGIPAPLPAFVKDNFSDVALSVPVFSEYFEKVSLPNSKALVFEDPKEIIGTTPDYFKLTDYHWLQGNKDIVFKNPNEVVLTASRAKLYFPKNTFADIIGKTLSYDSTLFTVAGIVEDLAYPSSFIGKEFMQIPTKDWTSTTWTNSNSNWQMFIKVKSPNVIAPILKSVNAKFHEMTNEEFKKYGFSMSSNLIPLSELHFTSFAQKSSDKKTMYGIIGIGIFLLILACINYINLTTAQVPHRAKEIGIRKTLGESQKRITVIFFLETFIITILALLLSWPLVKIIQSSLSSYIPQQMYSFADNLTVLSFIAGTTILITLLSSWYPAMLINRVKISEVIKITGGSKVKMGGLSLRKTLIVFQFVIAQIFVVSTFIIGMQLKHSLNSKLGFNKEAIITLQLPYKSFQNADTDPFTYKHALEGLSVIKNVSLGHLPMSGDHWGNSIVVKSDTGEVRVDHQFKFIDDDYFKLYNINILAGRAIKLSDTASGIALNLVAIEKLGFKSASEAIGNFVKIDDQDRQIVTVIDNFHSKNMHSKIGPLELRPSNKKGQLKNMSIQLPDHQEKWPSALQQIEKEWKKYYPNAPFKYEFYDQQIKNQYENDTKFSKIINLSTSITILLSCLGLIGLVTITTAQRTKEIGIRKVLGSKISGIIALLSKEYIKLIFISILIASPIAWWAMNHWLNDFAYKITLSWWMFTIPAVITLLIAFITMSYHSIKAANANPVESLRDE
ncbi:ABC transporter permease [Sphingobacterium sp. UDSM-2020]|uniref:ABC transporter permease n=1 Tax=Sphingobacterium sp. UDSM-2020 TaxID=2795738 RepID=UPI001936D99A|nr:FtsX-like permease family protein [Sphingobacterium sp. UDSM-2020]QQD14479.1 ABC transporter permease [Sphingobacterium sp. UDSM-2020]